MVRRASSAFNSWRLWLARALPNRVAASWNLRTPVRTIDRALVPGASVMTSNGDRVGIVCWVLDDAFELAGDSVPADYWLPRGCVISADPGTVRLACTTPELDQLRAPGLTYGFTVRSATRDGDLARAHGRRVGEKVRPGTSLAI